MKAIAFVAAALAVAAGGLTADPAHASRASDAAQLRAYFSRMGTENRLQQQAAGRLEEAVAPLCCVRPGTDLTQLAPTIHSVAEGIRASADEFTALQERTAAIAAPRRLRRQHAGKTEAIGLTASGLRELADALDMVAAAGAITPEADALGEGAVDKLDRAAALEITWRLAALREARRVHVRAPAWLRGGR